MVRPILTFVAIAVVAAPAAAFPLESGLTERVIVTATRRAEDISQVPSSVGALTQDDMASFGIKDFSEAVRFLPGVAFDPSSNTVAIRGISSGAGAGTTGIYIDDVPIQMRSLDYNPNNALPAVFDLERLEVLRGPQGTLFGAGSEGGAVRYITVLPNLKRFEGHGRVEASAGRNGSWNYEAGAAVSGPLSDELAFRLSAWGRHEGGTVDRFDATAGGGVRKNANSSDTYVFQGAVLWQPSTHLTLTASDFAQNRVKHDTDYYWVALSDRQRGDYSNGTPERLNDGDHFNLSSLKAEYEFGSSVLISNTSYFTRQERVRGYSGTIYNLSYFQQLTEGGTDPFGNPCTAGQCAAGLYSLLTADGVHLPGFGPYEAIATVTNKQSNFVQEVRLQSNDPLARLTWIAGAYYGLNTQHSIDAVVDPQLGDITQYLWGLSIPDAWGVDLLPDGTEYINDTIGHDSQIALFANATFALTEQWKLQGGLRYAHTRFDFRNFSDGPQNFGPDGGTGKQAEDPVTTMASLSYTPNEHHLFYVSYATGYRIGGANQPFPEASCQADLDELGLTSVPRSFNSDRVSSIEVGAKSQLGERLRMHTSVYRLHWSRMQQSNYLSSCGFQYVANFGSAVSTGFDLDADWQVSEDFALHAALGYTDAHFSRESRSGPAADAAILARRGDALPGAPWSFAVDANYRVPTAGYPTTIQFNYEFSSAITRMTPQTDPVTSQYDPGLVNDPGTSVAAIRIQTAFDVVNVTVFVENLFDSQPQLGLTHQDQYTALYEAWTLRPRTIGVSLSRRF